MRYDRTVIAYHGCDAGIAARLLDGGSFKPSENDYDWLGRGIYFWEYGTDRAWRFAEFQQRRSKIKHPAVIGAEVQLGACFDLMDTRNTRALADAFAAYETGLRGAGHRLPANGGGAPDHKLRRLDCAVLNWYLDRVAEDGLTYDTVRCGFLEGGPIHPGAGIHHESHIQIAVRNPDCVLGVFRPTMRKP